MKNDIKNKVNLFKKIAYIQAINIMQNTNYVFIRE